MPKLGALIKKVQEYAKRGYIRGIDGRRLWVRSPHASLNTLLQGAGAICCKQWSILLYEEIEKLKLDAHLVNTIHDEQQYECHKKDVAKLCEIADTTMQEVGVGFNMNIRLRKTKTGGENWDSAIVPFRVEGGIDVLESFISYGIEAKLITQAGAWYTYGDVKAMGMNGLKTKFVENEELFEKLKDELTS